MRTILIVWPFATFFGCLVLHIMLWRLKKPVDHALALLAVFLLPIPLVFTIAAGLGFSAFFSEWAAIFLLHAALSCVYIQLYPASQADSPSLKIMMLVSASMPQGLTAEEITGRFDPGKLFKDRLEDLLAVGHIRIVGDRVSLTPKGRFMLMPFVWLRRSLGLPWGRG